ncbi:protein phosphatase [Streptomyces sp. NPDC048604]|uniref:protein-tyrosine phosphatase family protein n=1 Tax=Streptomyces sp. NPDC048604 TaxID=3365578 RepID=UPI00370FD246
MPEPGAPWSEIIPGLWMGGHFWDDGSGIPRPAVAKSEFSLVVSLFTRSGHGPDDGVDHLVHEIPDNPLTFEQLGAVREAAAATAAAVRDGRPTLVRCFAGYNRSGLVTAQALVELGLDAEEAVALIRRRRSSWALHNEVFVQYLETGLDVAQLLTGLDSPAP